MKTITKILLIVASVLIVGGAIFFGVAVAMEGGIPTVEYKTETYSELEAFTDITVEATTANIKVVKSTDQTAKVVCFETEKEHHIVSVSEGELSIKVQDDRKWYDYIGIFGKTAEITVYLPNDDYGAINIESSTGDITINKNFTFSNIQINGSTGDVDCYASAINDIKISVSTGDIEVSGVSANNLDLKVSTGEIEVSNATVANAVTVKFSTDDTELNNLTATNLTVNGGTGDVELNSVVLMGKMSVTVSTGDVTFSRIDASEIKIDASTGNISGSILTSKIFIAETDTGSKRVPNTTEGGICEIKTSTGDINIRLAD
ncbi:MAG: DUF4097 domain-containing protein [Clostridiales bacterium]|nr:DUF4097 domain-containing protein [Clostridiales bacterium]